MISIGKYIISFKFWLKSTANCVFILMYIFIYLPFERQTKLKSPLVNYNNNKIFMTDNLISKLFKI